jgi:hypothetical protein
MDTQFQLLVLLLEHYNKTGHMANFTLREEVENLVFELNDQLKNKPENLDNLVKKYVFGALMTEFCRGCEWYCPDNPYSDDDIDWKEEDAADLAEDLERKLPLPVYGLRAENARIFHRSDRKALHRGHRCGRK